MAILLMNMTGCTQSKIDSTNPENNTVNEETILPEGIPEGATITLSDGTVISPDELPEGVEIVPKGSSTTKIIK